jgi:Family of unknown function (DUF6263)
MTTHKPRLVQNMNTQLNMRSITVLVALCLAGSAALLSGCSKSKTGGSSSSGSNGGGSSAPVTLKIKWQVGKQYPMQMVLDQAQDIDLGRQQVHQKLNLTQGFHYSPLTNLDNGGSQVQMEFDSQNLSFNQNGQEMLSYDTSGSTPIHTNRQTGPIAAVMHAMLNAPIVYTFGADGQLESMDGIDSLTSRIDDAMPNNQQRMQFQQLFEPSTLKRYGQLSEGLPDHPVSIGDSWSWSQDITNETGVMKVDATCTFKGWEQHNGHNCAHLLVNGDIKTKTVSAAATGAAVTVKKGIISGENWFDPELGMFVDINSDQDLTMDIKTQNMAMTDHMKQNVRMSLTDASQ